MGVRYRFFFLSPARRVEPGAFFLLDFRFTFLFSHSPHDLDTLTFLISLLRFFLSPHLTTFFDSRASSNPRKFLFPFPLLFLVAFTFASFQFPSRQPIQALYIHTRVPRSPQFSSPPPPPPPQRILNSRSQQLNNSILGFITIPFVVSRPFFYFKFSLESTHLYVWFVNLFRGLTNNLFE